MRLRGKKAQLTIFVILGVVIVTGVLLAVYLVPKPNVLRDPSKDPQGYISDCMRELIETAQSKLLPQAGYRTPSFYLLYKNTKVPYLCYTSRDMKGCTIVEPMLRDKIQEELKLETQNGIEKCFEKLKSAYQNYGYEAGPTNYSIEIVAGMLITKVEKEIIISREESSQELKYFEYKESNPIFDFIILSNDILTKEASCNCDCPNPCKTDLLLMNQFYPRYELSLFVTGKNEKIYTIKDTITGLSYMFSVRNCVRVP